MSRSSSSIISPAARGAIPKGFNFPQSVTFDPSATLPPIMEGGRVHYGFVFALVAVADHAVVMSGGRCSAIACA